MQVSDDVGVVLGEGVVQECVVGEDDHELERELQDILLSISSGAAVLSARLYSALTFTLQRAAMRRHLLTTWLDSCPNYN